MKKKSMILICILIVVFVGCSPKTDQELYYGIQKNLNKIDRYYAKVEITSIGNKGPHQYLMNQWFKKPNKYKLEVISPENIKGKTTISDGNKAWIYNPNIDQTWIMKNFINSEVQNTFLGYFVENVLNSEEVEFISETMEGKEYMVISTDIPGNHAYYHREQLYIDLDTLNPTLLQVYDSKDKLRIEVKYLEFEYNPNLDDNTFYIGESY